MSVTALHSSIIACPRTSSSLYYIVKLDPFIWLTEELSAGNEFGLKYYFTVFLLCKSKSKDVWLETVLGSRVGR